MRNFLRSLLPCQHDNVTWPMRLRSHDDKRKLGTHIACVDCGTAWYYDWETMQRGEVISKKDCVN
jgi:hypothetical protein